MSEVAAYISALHPFIQALLANSAVVGVVAWVGKFWAEKKIESIKGDHALKLEAAKGEQTRELAALQGELANIGLQIQAGLDKKLMVFKTHFDLEFQNYRTLWALCDDSANIAHQTLKYFQLSPRNAEAEAEEKIHSIERYDKCRVALDECRKMRPFIAKEVAAAATALIAKCVQIAKTYKDVYSTMNQERGFDRTPYIDDLTNDLVVVVSEHESTADLIAARISRMYVGEFGTA